jgi:hypothetical protein
MFTKRNGEHEHAGAQVSKGSQHKCVGSAGGIASSKIRSPPQKYRGNAVGSWRELEMNGHARRG